MAILNQLFSWAVFIASCLIAMSYSMDSVTVKRNIASRVYSDSVKSLFLSTLSMSCSILYTWITSVLSFISTMKKLPQASVLACPFVVYMVFIHNLLQYLDSICQTHKQWWVQGVLWVL